MTTPRVNLGSAPNSGTGDPLRTAFQRVNQIADVVDAVYADVVALQADPFALPATYVGAWASATLYPFKSVVTVADVAYISTVIPSHTSGGSFATDLAAGKWQVHQGITAADVVLDSAFSTLQAAVTAAAGKTLYVRGFWDQTGLAEVVVPDETVVFLEASAHVTTSTPNISLFSAAAKHDSHVFGFGKLSQTGTPGVNAYVAAVDLSDAVDCTVSGFLRFEGFQWCGVFMQNATRCKAVGGTYRNWLGTVDNSAAAIIYQDCVDCTVDGIDAEGTGWMGAYIQDPGGAGVYNPTGCKIVNSRVRDVTAYGFMIYTGATGNANNEISDCEVEGVTGTAGLGQYGMGIYCVGFALGGVHVVRNKVSDCCQQQTVFTNGCAGIVLTGMTSGYKPAEVNTNSVDAMTQGDGIELVTMLSGVVLGPNDVMLPASNDGTGPGGAGALGTCLKIWNCLDVSMSPGNYKNLGAGSAVTVIATDRHMTGICLSIGNAAATEAPALNITEVDGFTISGSITGGDLKGLSDTSPAANIGPFIGPVTGVTMSNGTTNAATPALQCGADGDIKFSGCSVDSTGVYSVSIGVGCAGKWDRSNSHSGQFESLAAAFKAEVSGAGRPTVGVFQISDLWFNTDPTAGEAELYRCLTAGSGTHTIGVDWFPVGIALPCVVADLFAAAAGLKNARGMVTNANATIFAAIVAGGGSNNVPVYCDGTNWRIG